PPPLRLERAATAAADRVVLDLDLGLVEIGDDRVAPALLALGAGLRRRVADDAQRRQLWRVVPGRGERPKARQGGDEQGGAHGETRDRGFLVTPREADRRRGGRTQGSRPPRADPTARSRRSRLKGFSRSVAPGGISTGVEAVPPVYPDMNSTRTSGRRRRTSAASSGPVRLGITTSVSTRSMRSGRAR